MSQPYVETVRQGYVRVENEALPQFCDRKKFSL